jgi:YlmC/YmxH family sporulation protein
MKDILRFCNLKEKDVINRCDCKRLGKVNDLIFDSSTGCICSIIIPGPFCFLGLFGPDQEYVIPWNKICQIGPDVVLVEVCEEDVLMPRRRSHAALG